MIKLVAFDVDGTLRDRDYLPGTAVEAVGRLREAGVAVTLCTGRSVYEMKPLQEALGIEWTICCNGSHIAREGRTVSGQPFDGARVRAWLETAEQLKQSMLLYGAEQMWLAGDPHPWFEQAREEIGFMEPAALASPYEVPDIYQTIVFCPEADEARYLSQEDRCYKHRWRPWAVDFNPAGMSKAVGLRKLMEQLDVRPEETAAFGDGTNDFEMMDCVGLGIAMGNACEPLKARAKQVTKPLHEDGVAYGVDRWILKNI